MRAVAAVAMLLVATLALPGALRAAEPCEKCTVTVVEERGRWESGYGERFYNVVGKVKNAGPASVSYVKIEVDALDAAGKVLSTATVYNESADALAAPDAKVDEILQSGTLPPLEAGREQRFRASFLADESPGLASHRVRIVAAPPAGCAGD